MNTKLHVYTGDGKGKTTAAVGMLIRSAGHQFPGFLAQFLKDSRSGELIILKQMGVTVFPMPQNNGFYKQLDKSQQCDYLIEIEKAIDRIQSFVIYNKPRLIVYDELCMAIHYGIVKEIKAKELINLSLKYGETIVTGRYAPSWLEEMADYFTEMNSKKHPYTDEHLSAREGIEW